jgi:hypothetical protein
MLKNEDCQSCIYHSLASKTRREWEYHPIHSMGCLVLSALPFLQYWEILE